MKPLPKTGIIAGIAIAAMCQLSCDRSPPSSPPGQHQLEKFDGVIDYSEQTYGTVKSDLYVRAGQALEDGDATTAKSLYREAIAKFPGDPHGYEALGACHYFVGDYEAATAEYLRALEFDSRSFGALYGLGCVAYGQQRYREAEVHLEQAVAIDATDGLCHLVLAMVCDEIADVPRAILHYEKALELDATIAGDGVTPGRLEELKR